MRLAIAVFVFSCIFLGSVKTLAQDPNGSFITDPSITTRCKKLLETRDELIQIKQKVAALIKRNERILKITPIEKKSLREKAERNAKELSLEKELNLLKIQNSEETIIKSGCPGIVR